MRGFRGAVALSGIVLVIGGVLLPTSTAAADPILEFDEPRTVEVEYGQYWQLVLRGKDFGMLHKDIEASIPTLPSYPLTLNPHRDSFPNNPVYAVTVLGDQRPLGAGTYSVVAGYVDADNVAKTTTLPAGVVIKPAALVSELRVVADKNNPINAVVTVRFTGRFIDEFYSSTYIGSPLMPSGEWSVDIADASGETVKSFTVTRNADDDVVATTFYWDGAKSGETYTASAAFAPTGDAVKNFTIATPGSFEYTAATATRPVPQSTASAAPADSVAAEPDFGVPLWWVILIGVALAALIVFAVVFAIKLGKSDPLPRKVAA